MPASSPATLFTSLFQSVYPKLPTYDRCVDCCFLNVWHNSSKASGAIGGGGKKLPPPNTGGGSILTPGGVWFFANPDGGGGKGLRLLHFCTPLKLGRVRFGGGAFFAWLLFAGCCGGRWGWFLAWVLRWFILVYFNFSRCFWWCNVIISEKIHKLSLFSRWFYFVLCMQFWIKCATSFKNSFKLMLFITKQRTANNKSKKAKSKKQKAKSKKQKAKSKKTKGKKTKGKRQKAKKAKRTKNKNKNRKNEC